MRLRSVLFCRKLKGKPKRSELPRTATPQRRFNPFKSSTPSPTTLIIYFDMSENLSHLVPFDGGSHNFAPYRPPAETRRLTRHAPNTTFVRPGETVPDFMIAAQPDQHQSHQSGNVPAPQFQQTRPPTRDSLQQRRDYGDDFENEQLINPQSGAFHAPSAGQMLPPAPLSQNGLAMVNPAHPAHNDGFAMLPSPIQSFQQDFAEMSAESTDPTSLVAHGELRGFKAIPDPPDLDYWRDRLFNVDEMITLSEDEYVDVSLVSSIYPPARTDCSTHRPGSILTFRMLTMYIPIARHSGTSVSPLSRITGTVG